MVTSAFHMPRAKKVFEAAKINIIPFPVDYKRKDKKTTLLDYIPTASSFGSTSYFFKEIIKEILIA